MLEDISGLSTDDVVAYPTRERTQHPTLDIA